MEIYGLEYFPALEDFLSSITALLNKCSMESSLTTILMYGLVMVLGQTKLFSLVLLRGQLLPSEHTGRQTDNHNIMMGNIYNTNSNA